MAGMTPRQIDDFNARRAARIVGDVYDRDRQRAMDERAAMPLDAESFWSEAGRALSWGAASAIDETIETGRQAAAELAGTEQVEGMEQRMAEVGEGLGVQPEAQPDRQAEVTMFRDAFGLEPPTTAGGQMASAAVQATTGAAVMWPFGPAMGTGKLAAAAGKAVEKVAPKVAASPMAQAAGRGAVEGQVAFGASAFAAFDGQDQAMLVALNENPAFERFVWDMLASPDPDAGEWENRFRRLAEEGVFGGMAGAMLGAVWQGTKMYVKGMRGGQPGHVLEGPAKEAVRGRQEEEAVTAAVRLEREAQAEDVALSMRDPYEELDDDLDEFLLQVQQKGKEAAVQEEEAAAAAARPPEPEEVLPEPGPDASQEEWFAYTTQQQRLQRAERGLAETPEAAAPVEEDIPMPDPEADVDEWIAYAQRQRSTREKEAKPTPPRILSDAPTTRDPIELSERELVPLARAATREQLYEERSGKVSFEGLRSEAGALFGAAVDTGLNEVATPALGLAQRHATARIADASASGGNPERVAAAFRAVQAWRRVYSNEWRVARGKGWRAQPTEEPGWERTGDLLGWLKRHKIAMANESRVSPDLDPAGASMVVASVRAEPVSEVRARRPSDWGAYREDGRLDRQRPEAMPSIQLPKETRWMLRSPLADDAERPVDIHFPEITTPDDVAMAYNVVAEARAADVGVDHTATIDVLSRKLAQQSAGLKRATEAFEANIPREDVKRRRKEGAKLAKRREERDETRAEMDRLVKDQEELEKTEGSARAAVEELLDRNGYGRSIPGVRRLREGVDPRVALHMIEATTGSLQRVAKGASADGVSSTQRAAGVRALHTADGIMKWLRGDDRGAGEAFQRADLPAEEGALVRAQVDDPEMANEVQRRLRDKRLVAQSGGSQRVQAQLANIGLARDGEKALHALAMWREDARFAWSVPERMSLHSFPKSVMQIRMAGMLSRPGTAAMNLTSGALFSAMRVGERFLSEAYDVQGRGVSGALSNAAAETADMVMAMGAGLKDGWTMLRADAEIMWKGDEAVGSVEGKLEKEDLLQGYRDASRLDQFENYARASRVGVPELLRDVAADTKYAAWADMADKTLDVGLTYGTKMAQLGDMVLKGMNRRMELHRLAAREVRRTMGERTPENKVAWNRELARLMQEPPDPEAADPAHLAMHRRSKDFAHVTAFTNESLPSVEQYVELMGRYPALRLITPFVRTPMNVFTRMVERSPFGVLLKHERDAWKKGAGTEERRDFYARQTVGATAMMMAGGLVMNGLLSGSEPRNDQLRRAWRATGKKPYSIKLGGAWVDYRQILGPKALALVIGADGAEMLFAAETAQEHDAAGAVAHAGVTTMALMVDAMFLSGYMELIELVGEDITPETFGRYMRRQAESFGPNSALMRSTVRQFMDAGYVVDWREAGGAGGTDEEFMEKVAEEWTTLRNTMADRYFGYLGSGADRWPKRDHRGRVVSYQTGTTALGVGDILMGFAGPAAYSYEGTDPLSVAEREVEFHPGWPSRTRLESLGPRTGITRAVEYTREEYDWLVQTAGKRYSQDATRYVQTSEWQRLRRGERRAALASIAARHRTEARRRMDQDRARGRWPELSRSIDEAHRIMEIRHKEEVRATGMGG